VRAVTSTGDSGAYSFPENLALGQHEIAVSFAGNAQYGPSTFTGYFNVVAPDVADAYTNTN
jgi:hypothetical protein